MNLTKITKKDGSYTKGYLQFMCKHFNKFMFSTDKDRSIFGCYKKPSQEKCRIYAQYLEKYCDGIITRPTIISHNSQYFTLAFYLFDENDNISHFVVVTKYHKYIIENDIITEYWTHN